VVSDPHGEPRGMVIRASPRVFAPDWRARMRSAPPAAWVAIATLLLVGGLRDPHLFGWLVSLAAVVLAFAVPCVAARVNASLVVSEDTVTYRSPLRRVHVCSRREVVRIERVRMAILGPRFAFTHLLFLNGRGLSVLSLPEEWWSTQDVERVQADLGVPINTTPEELTPEEANRRFPGAASFALMHRVAIGVVVLCLGGVTLLGVLGAVVGSGHK
jgi:hypothetical protein